MHFSEKERESEVEIGRDRGEKMERWGNGKRELGADTERYRKMKVRVFCKQPWQ